MDMTDEDAELVRLARSARSQNAATSGASVRDQDGGTHAATNIGLPSLRVSSLQMAVAMAVSSGATGLQAAAVVCDEPDVDVTVVRDLAGSGVRVHIADIAGRPRAMKTT